MTPQHLVQQAGQVVEGPARVGVFRTLTDQHGPYAVLRVALDGAEEVHEVTLRPGERVSVDGVGELSLVAMDPSTPQRRGAVRLALHLSGLGPTEAEHG